MFNKHISTSIAILMIVIVAALAGGVFYWQYKEVEEVKVPEIEKQTDQKKADKAWNGPRIISVTQNKDERKITFHTQRGEFITETDFLFERERRPGEGSFLSPKRYKWSLESGNAVQAAPNIFYFFAFEWGGSVNDLFEYDANKDKVTRIKDPGGSMTYYTVVDIQNVSLSPDGKVMIVKDISSGGSCNFGENVYFIALDNIKDGKYVGKHDSISGAAYNQGIWEEIRPETSEYHSRSRIIILDWINDDCLKFCLADDACTGNFNGGIYKYCLSRDKIELIDKGIPQRCLVDIPEYRNYMRRSPDLAKGTEITMADGSHKNIEDIEEGDHVKSFNPETKEFNEAEVVATFEYPYSFAPTVINGTLKTGYVELYLGDGNPKQIFHIEAGNYLLNEEGKKVKINSIRELEKEYDSHGLMLEEGKPFFADGFLVHTLENY